MKHTLKFLLAITAISLVCFVADKFAIWTISIIIAFVVCALLFFIWEMTE